MPQTVAFATIDDATEYEEPQKRINTEVDVETFSRSVAYARITAFITFLADALPDTSLSRPPSSPSQPIQQLLQVLKTCEDWMQQCPPHTGARRFGNLAFREWHQLLNERSTALISQILPEKRQAAHVEIVPYFLGAFGSAQRLDYGTGHELSFIAFICTLYQLEVLSTDSKNDALSIGLLVYPAYLKIIQRLVVHYTLEPAGSHGVWGLDDHFAMPYLLGAAQLSHVEPTIYPTPASITSAREVKDFREQNLYFNAIGFINDVKKGPFWEHSPMLYDISGIDSWQKIALGMKKMYNVEVLGKFPVVQHFPFGPIFFPFIQQDTTHPQQSTTTAAIEDNAVADLQQVRDRTSALHVSEYEHDRQALDADTPVPQDYPTRAGKVRKDMPPPAFIPPTSVPWKKSSTSAQAQTPTAAPWTAGTIRHSLGGSSRPSSATNRMQSSRTPATPSHGQSLTQDKQSASPSQQSTQSQRQDSMNEEQANTEGLEDGIGVDGMPGTKAPFGGNRTIHPAVLASMQARGEVPP